MTEERDREREHKRVRQACANCRRKKTRCSGERPVCAFCARLGQTCRYTDDVYPELGAALPEENHRLAARVALLESRLSMLDAASVDNAFISGSTYSADQHLRTSASQQDSASPDSRIDNDFACLLDRGTLQALADIYFRHCHQQPYTYFHEATFRQNLDQESFPSYLIYAFAATAVRFSKDPRFVGRQAEAMNCYSRMAWSDIMEQSFSDNHSLSISTVQAASMLGIIDYVTGRSGVAWVKLGLAIRLAQTLQLGREPHSWLLPHEAEERRHTFWSVYLLDKLMACGRDRPPVILDVDCTVRLPVNPCSFQNEFGPQPPTLAIIQEIPDMAPLEKSDHFALTIFMVSTLGQIARWAFKHSAPETRLPWDSRSEFARISGILLSFESYSDACDVDFADILNRHFVSHGDLDGVSAAHFIYSHVVYHVNQLLLHHPFLLRQHLQSFKANVPTGFLRAAIHKSKDHAIRMANIFRILQQYGRDTFPSFLGYAAVLAGMILRLHAVHPTHMLEHEANAHLKSCSSFLDHKPVRWESYRRMSKVLGEFAPSSRLAEELLSIKLDRTPLEPVSEEELWQMCDYSWLVSSARLFVKTATHTPVRSESPAIQDVALPIPGIMPEFDALYTAAMSLDYSLLGDARTDDSGNLGLDF
ncbi:hypothetical protein IAQ61_008295 [Plenodomus lingam]|uniref:Zn(2)-C6 fungal-type domain-containing protein n=1 Tax=Leptosphaeria maculans (strain JN3 / isolate v23.1.3 / race Av1-4-5-6-7-8) TaxID=985895 RepID=E4ZQF4_LEPMJ|nr:hypothetical protein LEMA_P033030.1 [Plenodomus lingam JN3]KAH9867701.1 hypothetical protein IAQ61_008295 [Plenodomus lingam]CBX93629.1 hypothetical protein LEMA_P033030.1 [Plenodomus lingam JN3]